ncbi:MAG: low molecular weight phosphatase family protein [Microbacteriaceae bacterium]
MSGTEPQASAFTILTVCSGNICRSPIAQQLLRAQLADAATPFAVFSAGTIASAGQQMTDEAAAMSRRFGGRPDGHRSTPLSEKLVARAQLVLTATREHRAAVASLLPRASRYVFTLNQFARLVASADAAELARLSTPAERLAAIAARRGFAPPVEPGADDIDDPYLESFAVYERVATEIAEAAKTIAEALSDRPSRGGVGREAPAGGRVAGEERAGVSRPSRPPAAPQDPQS